MEVVKSTEVIKLEKEVEEVEGTFKSIEIITEEQFIEASAHLKKLRAFLKEIDKKEKEATKPLNQSLKVIRGWFKPLKTKVNEIILQINKAINKYKEAERLITQKINSETQKNEGIVVETSPNIPKTELKTRKVWKFRVVDKNKIKPEYLIPNEKLIGELVRKLHKMAEDVIGGIEVYYEETNY